METTLNFQKNFSTKPTRCVIEKENIPQDLKQWDHWLVWKYHKGTKRAISVKTQEFAKWKNPARWTTFEKAFEYYDSMPGIDGLMCVITPPMGIVAMDLDNAKKLGTVPDIDWQILKDLNTYTEWSPSKALRAFLKASPTEQDLKDFEIKHNGAEWYWNTHLITVTGNHIEGFPKTIEAREDELYEFLNLYMKRQKPKATSSGKLLTNLPANKKAAQLRKWLAITDGCQAGCHAHDKFFAIAIDGIGGFDMYDCLDVAIEEFYIWAQNEKHVDEHGNWSPWSLSLVRHKVHDAAKQPYNGKVGDKLEPDSEELANTWDDYDDAWEVIGDAPETEEEVVLPKSKESKIEKLNDMFLKSVSLKHPKTIGGETYFYDSGRYESVSNRLSVLLRQFMKAKRWDRSNNIVGNVLPNFCADTDVGNQSIPYWDGNCPTEVGNFINFKNGLLDISNFEIFPHTHEFVNTCQLAFDYDPVATCPNWLKFLNEIFPTDEGQKELLQEYMGYCLTQDTSMQKALVLVGKLRSGKGTIQKIFEQLVGKENATGFMLESLCREFGLSALLNKSVATVGELELNNNPHSGKIVEVLKSIIGEDSQSINTKYQAEFRSVKLPVRFVIATNTLPKLKDISGALACRFLFVRFTESFVGREDIGLFDRLSGELSGIANWAIEGLVRLRQTKKFSLGENHKKTWRDFSAQTVSVGTFVKECCQLSRLANSGDMPDSICTDADVSVSADDLYKRYEAWTIENAYFTLSSNPFYKDLGELLPKVERTRRTVNGGKQTFYNGIGLTPLS